MTKTQWTAVDDYFTELLVGQDPALEAALADSEAAGLPAIHVAPNQGKLLMLFARMIGARRILEIGTLGGYSSIWLARALPEGGKLLTLEFEARHAEVARRNIARAGLSDRVEIHLGPAIETLRRLVAERQALFDLVFIDADKESNALYLDWAARLGRPGTVVVVDNAGRAGEVADPGESSPQLDGVRRGLEVLGTDPRFDATALQTLDRKGWDGVAIAVLTDVVEGFDDAVEP